MDDVKRARIRRCENCWEFWRNCRAFDWPRCAGGETLPNGEPAIVLGNEYMSGPDENCPQGFWKGLAPMAEPESRVNLAERADRFITMNNPMLRRLDAVSQADALVEMAKLGLSLELAKEVAERLGLTLE